ncbi:MAG: EcoRV family type II restriction endonuclease [Neisseriaceae bacterium]|nr:EcoRV family type II restriction endonuclease [Neisseriaceae bacterium]
MYSQEKAEFIQQLKIFAQTLSAKIASNNEWNIRGFVDIFKNIYPISHDTKVISKILELHLLPHFLSFAEQMQYDIELPTQQNYYPDISFISCHNRQIKFAVDIKTTYQDNEYLGFCNGFTLGSHGAYFIDRNSTKNIHYPYNEYAGHFCLGIIYARADIEQILERKIYSFNEIKHIPAVIKNFIFFAEEKWKIASDKSGSGNTANIGSIQFIDDLLSGNGVFAKAGEEIFNDYWANYGKIEINHQGVYKKLSSFSEYLDYRGLPQSLNNPKKQKRKIK